MGRHLGIDFSSIWVGFGSQVGSQNRAKIDQKRCRKNDIVRKGLPEGMGGGWGGGVGGRIVPDLARCGMGEGEGRTIALTRQKLRRGRRI